jgi:hypothetical protein
MFATPRHFRTGCHSHSRLRPITRVDRNTRNCGHSGACVPTLCIIAINACELQNDKMQASGAHLDAACRYCGGRDVSADHVRACRGTFDTCLLCGELAIREYLRGAHRDQCAAWPSVCDTCRAVVYPTAPIHQWVPPNFHIFTCPACLGAAYQPQNSPPPS